MVSLLDGQPDCPQGTDELYCNWKSGVFQFANNHPFVAIAFAVIIAVVGFLVTYYVKNHWRRD